MTSEKRKLTNWQLAKISVEPTLLLRARNTRNEGRIVSKKAKKKEYKLNLVFRKLLLHFFYSFVYKILKISFKLQWLNYNLAFYIKTFCSSLCLPSAVSP